MTASFIAGFSCFGMVVLLYILYQFVQVFKELVEVLRESLQELKEK